VSAPKYIILWCSPGFGLVDVWLPVIRKLKEKDGVVIDFVFPDPSSLRLEDKSSDLFNLAEKFADNVIYKSYSGQWFVADTLIEASAGIKFSYFDESILQISNRLIKGKISKYSVIKLIGSYIFKISKYIIYVKERIDRCNYLYNPGFFENVDGILFDVTRESKFSNEDLRNDLKNIQKFSMFHGLASIWVIPAFKCNQSVEKRSDVTVYSMSNLESVGYEKCYGILGKNIIHAGIPKHDKDWFEFVYNNSDNTKREEFNSFVFMIGRPASPYNTLERKKKALKDIYDVVCVKHKLRLIVKTHPKESIYGVDGDIYRDALGEKNYGKTWVYSNSHPFILGKKSIFSISFYSGVALDMLAINKPTIEYLDLVGLPLYDNSSALRDEQGRPVFQSRYTNIVLGANSRQELEDHVESILQQYEETILPLRLRYKKYFSVYDGSSKMIADDIHKKI
jgi:hypothetical protein